jgi:hypothetical protein
MNFRIRLILSTSFLLLLFSLNLQQLLAAVKVSQASGNWSNGGTWGGSVPVDNDDIVISSGTTVSINTSLLASMSFGNVTVEKGGSLVVGLNDVKLRIKGNIRNDGIINLWQSSTYQADIWMYGNSIWSGTGSWNLSNINVQGNSLEPSEGLTLTLNGSLTAYEGSSFNKLNKYANIRINIQGTLNSMISSYPDFYYGILVISKTTGTVSFSPSTSSNMINLLGDLTLANVNDRLIVEAFNTLTLLGNVTGPGLIQGSATSSLVVDNLNAAAINPLRIVAGTHFRDFIINRPAGVALANGFIIRESLRLNNSCLLTLPPQTLTLGLNGTTPTAGSFFGNGAFIGSTNSSVSVRGNDTSAVALRFDQTSASNYTLKTLIADKIAGKLRLESGSLLITGNLNISDKNVVGIGSGTLILNIIPSFVGSGCLSGSRDANLKIAGTNGTGYSLTFDQLTPFGNSLKSYTQTRPATVTLVNKLCISETLNLTGAASILQSSGNLTLLSSNTQSAGIGPLLNSADVTGDVNVQVYLSGNSTDFKYRGYRSLSSPLNDYLIASNGKRSLAQLKDYIIITGPGGTSKGFDQGGNAQPFAQTLQTYNPLAVAGQSLFTPVDSIKQSLTPGTGFFAFFRGLQRGTYLLNAPKLNSPYQAPEPVTVTFKGPVNKFDVPLIKLHNSQDNTDEFRGYNLIGNPYPSSIDWTKVTRSAAVNDEVITLKPGGATASYLNGFSNNGGSPYIQTGQGFYVRTTVDGSTVSFKETSKTTSYPARLLSAPLKNALLTQEHSPGSPNAIKSAYEVLKLNLCDQEEKDETTIVFAPNENARADYNDALYFGGSTVSLASLSADGKRIAINFMPDIYSMDTLKLSVNAAGSGSYSLNFSEVPATSMRMFLKDSLIKNLTEIGKDLTYPFTIDKTNPLTYGDQRFSLVFMANRKNGGNTNRLITAYPNPASDEIQFDVSSLPEEDIESLVFDLLGRRREVLFKKRGEKITADIRWFEPGLYVAKFRSANDGKPLGEALFIKH